MDITTIGERIKEFRKANSLTQEELGAKIGVSAQVVSKWECGGVPDTELIPRIADCFGVSIDTLFGRDYTNVDVYHLMSQHILQNATPKNGAEGVMDAVSRAFASCYLSFLSVCFLDENGHMALKLEEWTKERVDDFLNHKYKHSMSFSKNLLAFVDKSEDFPFFLYMPNVEGRAKKLLEDTDYSALFADLGDPDLIRAMVYLSNRERDTGYSEKFLLALLMEGLAICEERAEQMLELLEKYNCLSTEQMKIDETVINVYRYQSNPYLFMLLHAAYYFLHPPRAFNPSYAGSLDHHLLKILDK